MTLNAQERAAVEAAKAWQRNGLGAETPLETEWCNAEDGEPADTFLYAIGHISGFRAGVEAAIKALNKNNEDVGGAYFDDINAIRALLAQEDEHGS